MLVSTFQSNTMKTCFVLIFWDKPSFPPIKLLNTCCKINCSYRVVTSQPSWTLYLSTTPTATHTQLPGAFSSPMPLLCHLAACWDFLIALQGKMEISQHSRVVLSIYKAAWELVTKCLRNILEWQFPTCSPSFSLTVLRVPHSLSPVFF